MARSRSLSTWPGLLFGASLVGLFGSGCAATGDALDGAPAEPDPNPDDVVRGTCPPAPPFGTDTGDYGPDVELTDCDGNPYAVHDLCLPRASWLFAFAGH